MPWLINKKNVKELALQQSKEQRAGRFKRVSHKFLLAVNESLRVIISERVRRHPSKGKTLMD